MDKQKKRLLFETIIIFFIYFIYISVVEQLLSILNIDNKTIINFVADLLFFFGMVARYKETISIGFKNIFLKGKVSQNFKEIFKWVFILFAIQLIFGVVVNLILGDTALDDNTQSIWNLSNLNLVYALFKVFIFSSIAEELLFRKTLRDILDNKLLFIVISAFFYAFMNIAYADWLNMIFMFDFLLYFLFYSVLSYVYVKYDNIVLIMFIKFIHAFIPLVIMLVGNI